MFLYNFCWIVLRLYVGIRWPITTVGMHRLPETGAGIICCNHISSWDPLVLITRMRRRVHFMAKEELYSHAFVRWLFPRCGMVRVRRGMADRRAIREVLSYLEQGDLCALFPEGTRHYDGELHSLYQGAAYFAIKKGVPLYPAMLIGDYRRLRSPISVRFGEPLYPPHSEDPDRSDLEAWTLQLSQAMQELMSIKEEA